MNVSIFDIPDILYTISEYLSFLDKIKFGKCCNMNFLKFYNFNNSDYDCKDLEVLFKRKHRDYYTFVERIKITSLNYKNILCQFIDINRHFYIKEYLCIFYPYPRDFYYIYYDGSDDDESEEYEKDEEELYNIESIIDKLCNISLEEFMYRIDYFYTKNSYTNVFARKLHKILQMSIHTVYFRVLIEIIEEYDVNVTYHDIDIFTIESLLPVNIYDKITDYYLELFSNPNNNVEVFCTKCGTFGHDNISKSCVLYNKTFEKLQIAKDMKDLLYETVLYYADKELHQTSICKNKDCKNSISSKCISRRCKKCCHDTECIYHTS